ncbi:three-Cys-motif partner protein TcmP [Desulfolutivibrio sulfoxidireducens]|uniref:three-Cys-motif partner protein TcmP n=1 Tax=Desulfolutivibrio sulfoxidireducens TaxID=2773299 RepID=UPI00159DC211|nr:three-Cys-motif partner protein TcmP [Desulfolutivibrio sulfoxidireducens]
MANVLKLVSGLAGATPLLRKYLSTYTSILHQARKKPRNGAPWPKSIDYIDAFAGSVTPQDKETQEYIDGSPMVAIKTNPGFDSFHFIDRDNSRIQNKILPLKGLYPSKKIEVHYGDCNYVLQNCILKSYTPTCGKRAFAFLDPYGLSLEWNTIQAIGNTKVIDVFINFPLMGIYRQLGDSPPDEALQETITKVMGCSEWFREAYKDSPQLTLPGINPRLERQNHRLAERLAQLYRTRLEKYCFEAVSRPVIMYNSNGGPLYALILASQKRLAVVKMHEIFDRMHRIHTTTKALD